MLPHSDNSNCMYFYFTEFHMSIYSGFTSDKLPEWLLPVSRYYLPPLTRVMNNFSTRKKTSNTWYSRPFHTHPGGYKLQFVVVANGLRHGKGTHVSVHLYLMKGESDSELEWPFKSQIGVRLLNWRENKQHVEKVIEFFTDKDPLSSCSRVSEAETSERASNGVGLDRFISHHDLDYNPEENKEYLCEDMLCFQVYEIILLSG